MTTQDWDEIHLSEDPAVELLRELDYEFVSSEELDRERSSTKEYVLISRLEKKLKELNPWLSDENMKRAVRCITNVSSSSLMEANEKIYNTLAYGISLEQDINDGQGKKSHNVCFINFENPDRNEFVVTRQFKVSGPKKNIELDVVLFINGTPIAVIECKSPTIYEPIDKAITQLYRYQEARDEFKSLGAPKFFETIQIIVATCGEKAKLGTVLSPYRHIAEWKIPYPKTIDDLNREHISQLFDRISKSQDILIYGALNRENVLDLIRNFVAFEIENGRTVKKIAKYQQYIAVNEALKRIEKEKGDKRGGTIWHTQGSGKSLTMLWLTMKLKRTSKLENPTLIIVTDRIDLDDQIYKTFNNCGYKDPIKADDVRDLRKAIIEGTGQTIMTTIQKFQKTLEEKQKESEYPLLSEAANIFILVDEAHRTEYKLLAANMRKALPNACYLAFTGTPIDKEERSTVGTFGGYIHSYTIQEAVNDGTTVQILYESRLPDLYIEGRNLDELFNHYFSDRTEQERELIKRKYGTEKAIAMAKKRIEAICLDVIDHYNLAIKPNGFKAQVVAHSRESACRYKDTLDILNAPPSAVLISKEHNDAVELVKHHKTEAEEKEIIRSFKEDPVDKLAIIVVCDKLLTGFDAPILQVMYLDSPLREHTLLQAIARTNRTAEKKTYGLVVDYWGISADIPKALIQFSSTEVKNALIKRKDEIPRLEARHFAVMRYFGNVDKSNLEACLMAIEPEDLRLDFDNKFRKFSESMDIVLPDPEALRYVPDLKWLGKLRNAAKARFRDDNIDLSGCGEKVKKLIDDHISAGGVDVLLEQVSILSEKFEEVISQLKTPEAKASEIEHAINHEIHVRIDEDPVFYESLKERLEKIIEQRKQARINAVQELMQLEVLVSEIRNKPKMAQDSGMTEMEYAFYSLFEEDRRKDEKNKGSVARESNGFYGTPKEEQKTLTKEIIKSIENIAVIDWIYKEDVQREMRRIIKNILRDNGYNDEVIEKLSARIMDLARVRLTE